MYKLYAQMKDLVYGPTINGKDPARKQQFLTLANVLARDIATNLGLVETVINTSIGNDGTSGEVSVAGYFRLTPTRHHPEDKTIFPAYIMFLQPEVSSAMFINYTDEGVQYTPMIVAKFMPHGNWHPVPYKSIARQEYFGQDIILLKEAMMKEYFNLYLEALQVNKEIDRA